MTEIEIANGYLRVVVMGFDKVLALKSSVEVPLTHVRGASQDPDALRERHGLRLGAPHSQASSRRAPSTTGGGGSWTSTTPRRR
jgi:hypothetical protein